MPALSKLEELVVEWCISSLDNDPQEWTCDRHWLTHCSGTRIWVANKWWGMHIEDAKFKISSSGADGYNRPFLELIKLRKPSWRTRLWSSFESWRRTQTNFAIVDWLKKR